MYANKRLGRDAFEGLKEYKDLLSEAEVIAAMKIVDELMALKLDLDIVEKLASEEVKKKIGLSQKQAIRLLVPLLMWIRI